MALGNSPLLLFDLLVVVVFDMDLFENHLNNFTWRTCK